MFKFVQKTVTMGLIMTGLISQTVAAGIPTAPADARKLPEWQMRSTIHGGKLLLSDSPETVTDDGIMYRDTVQGDTRLFFHHVNGTAVPKKIVVLLENSGSAPAQVTVYRHGLGGPSCDYLGAGKTAQLTYLKGGNLYPLEVPSGGSVSLVPELTEQQVLPNQLVTGIYDFIADQPVQVTVLMAPVDTDIRKFAAQAKILPPDQGQYRLRGTFDGKDRMVLPEQIYNSSTDGSVAITLADHMIDKYASGIDATDGTKTVNYGNYGVVYRVFLPSQAAGRFTCFLNPRGGEYAGGLGVKYRFQELDPVQTPAGRLSIGSNSSDAAMIGTYEGGQSLWLTFSPPGSSNLPVKLVLVPE